MAKKKKENKLLTNAPPENHFWVNNGIVLKNVGDLYTSLRKIKKDTFSHHVNDKKNDFSNWIRDVFNDNKLADQLRHIKTKTGFKKVLKKAIK